jgi:hypothetical protein
MFSSPGLASDHRKHRLAHTEFVAFGEVRRDMVIAVVLHTLSYRPHPGLIDLSRSIMERHGRRRGAAGRGHDIAHLGVARHDQAWLVRDAWPGIYRRVLADIAGCAGPSGWATHCTKLRLAPPEADRG